MLLRSLFYADCGATGLRVLEFFPPYLGRGLLVEVDTICALSISLYAARGDFNLPIALFLRVTKQR
jgi:hypothetical protein